MKRAILIAALVFIPLTALKANAQNYLEGMMSEHPEWYINVTDWSVYATWSAVAIIHHVTIENTSDITYKDVKVRVCYTSNSPGGAGSIVSQEVGVLPVTLPPKTKATYLKSGVTIGAGSQFMNAVDIQVLGATPVLD
ncbi:MAG: hypothetical protein RIG61_07245 [Deltaproteobacteria bacterium]